VSTPAVILFLLVAVVFVAMVAMVFVAGRSVYRRSRVLAQELTSLAADLERTMNAVGQPTPPDHRPGI
jgi:type II secretory pathway component PulJ